MLVSEDKAVIELTIIYIHTRKYMCEISERCSKFLGHLRKNASFRGVGDFCFLEACLLHRTFERAKLFKAYRIFFRLCRTVKSLCHERAFIICKSIKIPFRASVYRHM